MIAHPSPSRVTYSSLGRQYHINNRAYLSVTSVLGTVKDKRRLKELKKKLDGMKGRGWWDNNSREAMEMGTWFHWIAAKDLCNRDNLPLPEFEPERLPPPNRYDQLMMCKAYWADIQRSLRPRPYMGGIERFVYSSRGYAGRIDAVVTFSPDIPLEFPDHMDGGIKAGEPYIMDFKTSGAFYDDAHLAQCYAYREAWNEMYPNQKVKRMCVLRVHGRDNRKERRHWNWVEVDERVAKELWEKAMDECKRRGLL